MKLETTDDAYKTLGIAIEACSDLVHAGLLTKETGGDLLILAFTLVLHKIDEQEEASDDK